MKRNVTSPAMEASVSEMLNIPTLEWDRLNKTVKSQDARITRLMNTLNRLKGHLQLVEKTLKSVLDGPLAFLLPKKVKNILENITKAIDFIDGNTALEN